MSAERPFRPKTPAGIAFAIRDLVLLRAWAEWRGLRMDVALDHVSGELEYEELVGLYAPGALVPTWVLWRSIDAVMVEGLHARPEPFRSVSGALEALSQPVKPRA